MVEPFNKENENEKKNTSTKKNVVILFYVMENL